MDLDNSPKRLFRDYDTLGLECSKNLNQKVGKEIPYDNIYHKNLCIFESNEYIYHSLLNILYPL